MPTWWLWLLVWLALSFPCGLMIGRWLARRFKEPRDMEGDMEIDYPLIRKVPACPVCMMPKASGLVLCWTCNGTLKAKHDGGWGEACEALLLRVEFMLVTMLPPGNTAR